MKHKKLSIGFLWAESTHRSLTLRHLKKTEWLSAEKGGCRKGRETLGNTGYGVYAQKRESKGGLEQGFFIPTSGYFVTSKVVDPSHFNADPNPSFPFIVDLYVTFHLMRILI
jgi:hypothetical protein